MSPPQAGQQLLRAGEGHHAESTPWPNLLDHEHPPPPVRGGRPGTRSRTEPVGFGYDVHHPARKTVARVPAGRPQRRWGDRGRPQAIGALSALLDDPLRRFLKASDQGLWRLPSLSGGKSSTGTTHPQANDKCEHASLSLSLLFSPSPAPSILASSQDPPLEWRQRHQQLAGVM